MGVPAGMFSSYSSSCSCQYGCTAASSSYCSRRCPLLPAVEQILVLLEQATHEEVFGERRKRRNLPTAIGCKEIAAAKAVGSLTLVTLGGATGQDINLMPLALMMGLAMALSPAAATGRA